MVKWIVRAVILLIVGGWIGGTWYVGKSLEKDVRSLIRDDPSNIVEVVFDPFAEPEPEPLLADRVWLNLLDYHRVFFASIARIELVLRPAPGEDPVAIPLLLKFHHGPLIFAGGFAVGAARVQITLDDRPERLNLPPRWGRDAKSYEGMVVTRGLVAFDGAFQGSTWLQDVQFPVSWFDFDLKRMKFNFQTDAALSAVKVDGSMDDLKIAIWGSALTIDQADMTLRSNSDLDKMRSEGVMSVNWNDAELNIEGDKKHVQSMAFDTEYRLARRKLDAEVGIVAEKISTAAEEVEDREPVLDYGESVAAFGGLPVERIFDIWDGLRLWEPRTAALSAREEPFRTWRIAEKLMQQVSSDVSAYASLKVGVDDQELLVRANAEFMGEGKVEGMQQLKTVGELFHYLLADLTYHADGRLSEIAEVKQLIDVGKSLNMLEFDKIGPSGSVHVRAGEVRVNGVGLTPRQFLREFYRLPLWPPIN